MDSSSQKQSSPVVLGNCLSCDGLVRVPARAPANSKVRCPHCSESFSLAQILDDSIPELELISESESIQIIPRVDQGSQRLAEENGQEEREAFVVPPQLKKGAHSGRGRSRSSESRRTSDERSRSSGSRSRRGSGQRSESSESSADVSSSRGSEALSKRRPLKKSPMMEMAKVVFGGLLAIPIAYLMVFWIFRQDPLNVAPSLEKVAPFIVPSALREDDPKTNRPASPVEESKENASLAVPDLDPDKVLKDIDK